MQRLIPTVSGYSLIRAPLLQKETSILIDLWHGMLMVLEQAEMLNECLSIAAQTWMGWG